MQSAPQQLISLSRRRVSATGLLRLLALSVFPGALLASIWRVAFILAGYPAIAAVWLIVLILPLLIVIGFHIARPLPDSFAARIADRSLGLKDRLNTWYEFRDQSHPWFPVIEKNLIDAIKRSVPPAQTIRIRMPYEARLLPIPAAILAIAVLFPWEQIASGSGRVSNVVLVLDETADAVEPDSAAALSEKTNETGVIRMARVDLNRGSVNTTQNDKETQPTWAPAAVVVRRANEASSEPAAGDATNPESHETSNEPDGVGSNGVGGTTDGSADDNPGESHPARDISTPRARLDRAFVDQATRFPEIAVALVRYRKALE
ncbi:MAG: hypothetical protein ABIH86_03525 [Planctomycetota bacterium]